MALKGASIYAQLTTAQDAARKKMIRAEQDLVALNDKERRLVEEGRQALEVLVRVRVAEASDEHPLVALKAADQAVARLGRQRARAQEDSFALLKDAQSALKGLLDADEAAKQVVETARAAFEAERSNAWTKARFNNPAWASHEQALATIALQHEQVRQAVEQSKSDHEALRQTLLAEPLFRYCDRRGVGTSHPQGNLVTRAFDRALAASIGYADNVRRLGQAQAVIDGWLSHQASLTVSQGTHERWIEDARLAAATLPSVLSASDAHQEALAERTRGQQRLTVAKAAFQAAQQQADAYTTRQDDQSKAMRDRVAGALEKASQATLAAAAAETASPDDDRAVERWAEIRRALTALKRERTTAEQVDAQARKDHERLRSATDRFKGSNYNSSRSRFRTSDSESQAMLDGFILGNMTSAVLFSNWSSNHYQAPEASRSSYDGSSGSSSGSSSFSGGGSFGGDSGGFSSGGGF